MFVLYVSFAIKSATQVDISGALELVSSIELASYIIVCAPGCNTIPELSTVVERKTDVFPTFLNEVEKPINRA